ncbi:MAG: FkbM family methyltransferase [Vicinamibacterales bacterium]
MKPSVATEPIGRLVEALSPGILDIGARGGADEDMLPIAWASRIVCFEPDQAESEVLAKKGDARWREFTVLPFAVGGVSGPQELHVPDDPRAASLLRHNPSMVERFGQEHLHTSRKAVPVQTWTLDALRGDGHIGRIDYMKIDVEGAELDILGAGGTIVQDCVALKVECSFLPQRLEQPLVWDVAQFLGNSGFEVVDLEDIHRWRRRNLPAHPYRVRAEMEYSRGQAAQCDVIALRSVAHVHGTEQALRLVVVSAALGFFDYAVGVLRGRPELADHVRQAHGLDLEAELKRWSAAAGGRVVRQSLKASVRALVPLLRAWAGWLPFLPARPPY